MDNRKRLPIGVDNFEEFHEEDLYYVDKTGFIKELLANWSKVSLFTRPRRFGKSLNMSMLRAFFEVGRDASVFDGLAILEEKELCEKYMGRFPVIFISLNDVDGFTYEDAIESMGFLIEEAARRLQFLLESPKLSMNDKKAYTQLLDGNITPGNQRRSLKTLSELLYKHYDQKVIILIDEYDVPLDKAHVNGYYPQMVNHIRSFFGNTLKTNEYMFMAVITGCLRVAKESIFTGLTNFKVHTITDRIYEEYFGFTDNEVKDMLSYYGLSNLHETVKQWYDGYHFGCQNVYCPWDVINYVGDHLFDMEAPAKMYWINTSGNAIVRQLLQYADESMKKEIEQLVAGEAVIKEIRQELTYADLDVGAAKDSESARLNLWSVLFTTGYLTMTEMSADGRHYKLRIPNREVRQIFVWQIQDWMREVLFYGNTERMLQFCEAVLSGNEALFENMFNMYLQETISIRDTAVAFDMKENYFHGMLVGLLRGKGDWIVESNAESGVGYADIVIESMSQKTGCVIEVKYAHDGNLDLGCRNALEQIHKRDYTLRLRDDGMKKIHAYGVACYKKSCKVAHEDM